MKLLPVRAEKPPRAYVIGPLVNLNGTSIVELLTQYQTAINAIMEAETALHLTTPHARDYHPQGHEAFLRATVEHGSRLARLVSVRDEIYAILEDISNGGE